MTNTTDNAKTTPLNSLRHALCRATEPRLFHNQVIMYQLLIPFISNQLTAFSNNYAPVSVDDLISDIRRYIVFMYEKPGRHAESSEEVHFSAMHRYIYDNIANRDSGLEMEPYIGKQEILSVTELRGKNNLESNISSIINNRRSIPKKCEKILRANASDYTPILYRCFWMLQYYFVYYDRDICTISRMDKPISYSTSHYIEYFPLTENKISSVFFSLNRFCYAYTSFFHNSTIRLKNLISLSLVILDIIIEQINLHQQNAYLKRITVSSIVIDIDQDNQTANIKEPFSKFRESDNTCSSEVCDYCGMHLKLDSMNLRVKDALTEIYYRDKNYWMRDINHKLDQSFELAAECLKSENEYSAIFSHITWFLFRDAEELFREYGYNTPYYNDALLHFLSAICLADRLGAMRLFSGNNQIALFLIRHKKDEKLLHDLQCKLNLHVPFDAESQLEYAISHCFSFEFH